MTPFCRRGFALLASRFLPISVNPSTARPLFKTLAIVPRRKGATFTFRNTGTATVTIRATVDCTKIIGKPSLRTLVVSRAARLGARAAAAAGAQASARRGLAVVCGRRNSIPADIGFEARRNRLVRLAYFRDRRGRIGLRGVFSGNRPEKVKLFLSCVQGKGVRMVGQMAGGARSSLASPRASSSARQPKIVVSYYRTRTQPFSDLPFGGLFTGVDRTARVPWGSPMPTEISVDQLLVGRGYFDPRQFLASGITPLAKKRSAKKARGFIALLSAKGVAPSVQAGQLKILFHLLLDNPLLLNEVTEAGGPLPPTVFAQPPHSKTEGPFAGLPDCNLGFFIEIYLPSDAQEPITHQILDNDPPCQNAKITVEKFEAGTEPPDTPDDQERWKTMKTYRVNISGDSGPPLPFRIQVSYLRG